MDTLYSIFSFLFFEMLPNFRHFFSFSLILLLVLSGFLHQIKLLITQLLLSHLWGSRVRSSQSENSEVNWIKTATLIQSSELSSKLLFTCKQTSAGRWWRWWRTYLCSSWGWRVSISHTWWTHWDTLTANTCVHTHTRVLSGHVITLSCCWPDHHPQVCVPAERLSSGDPRSQTRWRSWSCDLETLTCDHRGDTEVLPWYRYHQNLLSGLRCTWLSVNVAIVTGCACVHVPPGHVWPALQRCRIQVLCGQQGVQLLQPPSQQLSQSGVGGQQLPRGPTLSTTQQQEAVVGLQTHHTPLIKHDDIVMTSQLTAQNSSPRSLMDRSLITGFHIYLHRFLFWCSATWKPNI